MEISKNHGQHLSIPAPHHLQTTQKGSVSESSSGREVGRSGEVEPQRLLTRLQDTTEVRNRLLVEIKAKVQAGEYSTRAAVEKAAEQILGL